VTGVRPMRKVTAARSLENCMMIDRVVVDERRVIEMQNVLDGVEMWFSR